LTANVVAAELHVDSDVNTGIHNCSRVVG